MGWFEIRMAFEDFVENKVFRAVESVGGTIEKVGDATVSKICEIEEQASLNPVKTAAIVATGAVAVVAAPVLGPVAASIGGALGVGGSAAAATGVAAGITAGEVGSAVVISAATTAGAIITEKAISALTEKKEDEDGEE